MKANPAEIFNYVVDTLPCGEILSIDCVDESQLDRIRMALYRQRNKLEKISPELASTITISKRVDKNSYSIVLGKDVERIDLFILDKDGNKQPLLLKSKDKEIREERLKSALADEGYSKEEIENYIVDRVIQTEV